MEKAIALIAVLLLFVGVGTVMSPRLRRTFRATSVEVQRSLPMPTAEWVIRRALEKIERKALATTRTKIMPVHATVVVGIEIFDLLEPVWPRVANDMARELAATARAEGWEGGNTTFSLKADLSAGRRNVDAVLVYPSADEVPTTVSGRRPLRRGAATVVQNGARPAGARWFVEIPGSAAVPLGADRDIVVGSDERSDVVVSSDSVSRRHLRVRWDGVGDMLQVEDLHSTNGSWLDDVYLDPGVPFAVMRDSWVHLGRSDKVRLIRSETAAR